MHDKFWCLLGLIGTVLYANVAFYMFQDHDPLLGALWCMFASIWALVGLRAHDRHTGGNGGW